MFVADTDNTAPLVPPLALIVSIVAVERRETHSPGMFSYASSNMTASLLKLAETDAAYGPSEGVGVGSGASSQHPHEA